MSNIGSDTTFNNGTNLTGADLTGIHCAGTFMDVNCSQAKFFGADIYGDEEKVSFVNANLTGADFTGCVLVGGLMGSHLDGANFLRANASSVNFGDSSVSSVNFTSANLSNADLSSTTGFASAVTVGANLTGAKLP